MQGARLLAIDSREQPAGLAELRLLDPNAQVETVTWEQAASRDWAAQCDIVVWSPGLSIECGPSAALYEALASRGLPVVGEIELFAQALIALREQGYRPKVVAITGTNGKTTTTQLVHHLCQAAGLRSVAAGNISPPALDALAKAQRDGLWPEVWILELSSFQLALSQSLQADAAAVLNISQDHLDWHANMASYIAAKRRIHPQQGTIVLNRADPATWPTDLADWPVPVVSTKQKRRKEPAEPPKRKLVAFGLDAPEVDGEFGRVQTGAVQWLARAVAFDDVINHQRLMPVDALPLKGAHNQANALAALALAQAVGVPMARMLHGLRHFKGDAHRCELIASIDGIEFYDDSKGTNVGATVAAIQGLEQPLVLIAGGDGKGQDFEPLAAAIARQAQRHDDPLKGLVIIGRDGPQIAGLVQKACRTLEVDLPIISATDLEQAVQAAVELVGARGAVVLSPACASFDMFRNYEHRADVFKQAVHAWGEARGQVVQGAS
jgi:UDP-N-acetylmuramoylalanine--D-glutamate ligase